MIINIPRVLSSDDTENKIEKITNSLKMRKTYT